MQGTEHTAGRRSGFPAVCRRKPDSLLARAFGRLVVWSERYRERRRLGDPDERVLRDLGLTREAVERESRRPFWLP